MDETNWPLWLLIGYVLFAALVQALPAPKEMTAPKVWYVTLYRWLHLIAANWRLFARGRYQGATVTVRADASLVDALAEELSKQEPASRVR